MASRTEADVVDAAGLVQGIVLVTFPAASTISTDPNGYDLSNTQYGAMFLPHVVMAIAGALRCARLAAGVVAVLSFRIVRRGVPVVALHPRSA